VEGAAITVLSGSGPYPELTLFSRADGLVQMSLPEGTFRIVAMHGNQRAVAEVSGNEETQIMLDRVP
jgi:hypothetical protein